MVLNIQIFKTSLAGTPCTPSIVLGTRGGCYALARVEEPSIFSPGSKLDADRGFKRCFAREE